MGGKLSAYRKTAEIPLKPRSTRIRKGSLSACFTLTVLIPLAPQRPPSSSNPLLYVLARGDIQIPGSAFKVEAAFTPWPRHQRLRRLGSSFSLLVRSGFPHALAHDSVAGIFYRTRSSATINNRRPSSTHGTDFSHALIISKLLFGGIARQSDREIKNRWLVSVGL